MMNFHFSEIWHTVKGIRANVWIALCCALTILIPTVMPVETGRSKAEVYLCFIIPVRAFLSGTVMVVKKRGLKFSLTDGIVTAWFLYAIVRFWFEPVYPAAGFAIRAFLMWALYLSMRMMFNATKTNGTIPAILFIVFSIAEAATGYAQIISGTSGHHRYPVTGTFLNPGPYSAYLALGVVIICAFGKSISLKKEIIVRAFRSVCPSINLNPDAIVNTGLMLLLFLAVPLILTLSRAAFLSIAISLMLLFFHDIKGLASRIITLLGMLTLGLILYYLKQGSAEGRGIINYIGIHCMGENPLTGNGTGSFFNVFANETARISMEKPYVDLFRADVLDYPFNDFLRTGIEQGLTGLFFALALVSVILFRLWRNCKPLFFGFLSLLLFSLFSYPFELLPYQIITVLITAYSGGVRKKASMTASSQTTFKCIIQATAITVISVTTSFFCLRSTETRIEAEKNYHIIAGLRDKAFIKDYYALLPYLTDNKRYLFDFAKLLSEAGRYNDSNDMLRRGALISNDPMFLVLQGNNYRDMKMYDEAEQLYLRAWHTMPNRIYPLYKLMLLHEETGNKEEAEKYAVKVISFKEKVPSRAVDDIKREAMELKNIPEHERIRKRRSQEPEYLRNIDIDMDQIKGNR